MYMMQVLFTYRLFLFKDLSEDEKAVWKNKAKGPGGPSGNAYSTGRSGSATGAKSSHETSFDDDDEEYF